MIKFRTPALTITFHSLIVLSCLGLSYNGIQTSKPQNQANMEVPESPSVKAKTQNNSKHEIENKKKEVEDTVLKDNWTRISIEGMCTLDLPPTMEVQSGIFKEFVDKYYRKQMIVKAPKFVAQQNGMNDMKKVSTYYARVMVDKKNKEFDFAALNQTQIEELNKLLKEEALNSMTLTLGTEKFTGKIISWNPVKVEIINGLTCLNFSYQRQIENNPIVLVHIYNFQKDNRCLSLTLSYRVKETDRWKADFRDVLNSFRM